MNAAAPAELMQRLAAIPASARLRLVPVRHHSPLCAWQLRALIRSERPQRVLIEGPAEANALLPYLAASSARPPLALYTCSRAASDGSGERARRAFYPLAEFSPEWVALREAVRIQAEVIFIDRPAAALMEHAEPGEHEASLLDDHGLGEGERAERVLGASGCRDFDHWWDCHFEAGCQQLTPQNYFERLQRWCLLLRERPDSAQCSARERAMAAHVAAACASGLRTLVVTGGIHTEAIAVLLAQSTPSLIEPADGRAECYLLPYALDRIDAAHDYAAGLPDTGYYQLYWHALERADARPERAAAEAAAQRALHGLKAQGETTGLPDAIEAVLMSERLAALRGVPLGRAEVLDALGACLLRDGLDSAGEALRQQRLRRLLSANVTGSLPRRYPRAPLVEDFRRRAGALGLPLLPGGERERALDLYRSPKHRQISQLLHQLRALGVPYAELHAGPDFAAGTDLERVREIWQLSWRPEVDARLTECQHFGAQLPEAALAALLQRAARHPAEAPRCLVEALRMGLHGSVQPLLQLTAAWSQRCAHLPELSHGLALLSGAWRAAEVLQSAAEIDLPQLLAQVFSRACRQIHWLGQMDRPAAAEVMLALGTLNTLCDEHWAARETFLDALHSLQDATLPAMLRGRAVGILSARGRLTLDATRQRLAAVLDSGLIDAESLCDYLLGFLPLARQVLTSSPALLKAFNAALLEWDEECFLRVLPGLRLAFTALKPREASAVLAAVLALESAPARALGPVSLDAAVLTEFAALLQRHHAAARLWGLHD